MTTVIDSLSWIWMRLYSAFSIFCHIFSSMWLQNPNKQNNRILCIASNTKSRFSKDTLSLTVFVSWIGWLYKPQEMLLRLQNKCTFKKKDLKRHRSKASLNVFMWLIGEKEKRRKRTLIANISKRCMWWFYEMEITMFFTVQCSLIEFKIDKVCRVPLQGI